MLEPASMRRQGGATPTAGRDGVNIMHGRQMTQSSTRRERLIEEARRFVDRRML